MKEIILLNERYGTVEIDNSGIITGCNKNGLALLSNPGKNNSGDLKGLNISGFTRGCEGLAFSFEDPRLIFSLIKGIKLIDSIYYKNQKTSIIRFLPENEGTAPFFNILKFFSILYMELDEDLNILLMSDFLCRLTGIDKSELYGSNISNFTDKSSTGKISSAAGLSSRNINDCTKINEIQFSFKGLIRNFDMEITASDDAGGFTPSVFCYLLDSSFEKKCKTLTRSIRRMSAVANFAGGIAHDYNNALTAVLGNISLAKMDAEKDSELEELLCDAESAGLKIKTLTERLGMFARGMKPAKDKTDIKKLIESALPDLFSGYKGQHIIEIQENMTNPEIDQELISEAFRHVIENAVDVSDKPGGEILIKADEIEISQESVFRETSLVSGKYIVISVRDNGPGVDPLSTREIFDPYVTTKDGREGLGLALAYTIIKRHRGFISVDTPENGGADFKIYIPLF